MTEGARRRLEDEFLRNPPADLTDREVVRTMCKENEDIMQPFLEGLDRLEANSLAQAFTKVVG